MNAIARSIRARGEAISLETASGDVEVRGIVGRGGDEERLGETNSIVVPDLTLTLASEDAKGVARGDTAAFGGSKHEVRGVVRQGAVTRLVMRTATA